MHRATKLRPALTLSLFLSFPLPDLPYPCLTYPFLSRDAAVHVQTVRDPELASETSFKRTIQRHYKHVFHPTSFVRPSMAPRNAQAQPAGNSIAECRGSNQGKTSA